MLGREGEVGEHVRLGLVHQRAELGPAGAQLVGNVPPGLGGAGVVGPDEGLPDRGRNHGVLALGHVSERVPHEVDAAALPGGADHPRDRALSPSWASEITSFTPLRPRRTRVAQEGRPEGLGL
jgi:hypothetical protein